VDEYSITWVRLGEALVFAPDSDAPGDFDLPGIVFWSEEAQLGRLVGEDLQPTNEPAVMAPGWWEAPWTMPRGRRALRVDPDPDLFREACDLATTNHVERLIRRGILSENAQVRTYMLGWASDEDTS
jgi:hypothetical protein